MPEKPKYSRLYKGIIYTTGVLFLDVIGGQALTGKPLHESLGVEFPDYIQKAEDIANHYWKAFRDDFKKLNISEPDVWCKATEHIQEQINMIK